MSLPPVFDRKALLKTTLSAIEIMDLAELRALWTQHFGTAPELRSVDLLRLTLSWRLQARVYGGLDAAIRKRLRRRTVADPGSAIDLEIGTLLNREWQGRRYAIEVVSEGFRWKDKTYSSLSAVARAITGTTWNGPRFFGLRRGKQ